MFGIFDSGTPQYAGAGQPAVVSTSRIGVFDFLSGLFEARTTPVYQRAPGQVGGQVGGVDQAAAVAVLQPVQPMTCQPVQPVVCQPVQPVVVQQP